MRLFFHLVDSSNAILDLDGVEVADLGHARSEALRALAEFRLENPSFVQGQSGWMLRVTDESGQVVLSLDLDGHVH